MRPLMNFVAAAAVSLTLGACASTGGAARPADAATRAPSASVKVENYNWSDVVVYAVQNNTRQRLGTVTSMSTVVFRVPERFMASTSALRLMVDPIGSVEGWETEGIMVQPGQMVSFSIQNRLPLSSVAVLNR